MEEHLYMGVDLGTSFIKTAVYDISGKQYAAANEPVADERPAPGVFLQHGEQIFESVCRCIKKTAGKLAGDAGRIAAIAFTGQMAGSMGVDEEWRDITTWSCSLDSRYFPYSRRQLEKYGDDIYRLSGTSSPVMCGKYEWFAKEFPGQAEKIAKYVMLNGYMIGKLSGIETNEAAIDYSLLAWTGMADIRRGCWSNEICSKLGMPEALLPRIGAGTDIGGYLSEKEALRLGLPSGIPLILGAGDKVAGCIGAGISHDGDKIFEASSYAALSVQVDDFRPDTEQKEFDIIGSIRRERFYVHKYLQGSGITLDWFINEFVLRDGETSSAAFKRIEKMAAEVPAGSDHMLAVGLLGGSAMPFQPDQKGLFFGHTWSHGKGHFYRSLLEGFTYELAGLLDRVDTIYPEYAGGVIRLIGGGAHSAVWPQIMADVTGRSFAVLSRDDVALWGTALLAALAVGDVSDIAAAADAAVGVSVLYTPDSGRTAAYRPYIEQYSALRRELQGYYASLGKI